MGGGGGSNARSKSRCDSQRNVKAWSRTNYRCQIEESETRVAESRWQCVKCVLQTSDAVVEKSWWRLLTKVRSDISVMILDSIIEIGGNLITGSLRLASWR